MAPRSKEQHNTNTLQDEAGNKPQAPKSTEPKKKERKKSAPRKGGKRGRKKKRGSVLKVILITLLSLLLLGAVALGVACWKYPMTRDLTKKWVDYQIESFRKIVMDNSEKHVYGIDVSRYQFLMKWDDLEFYYNSEKDTISFEETNRGIPVHFVFMKATQGRAQDPTYSEKKRKARKAGIKTGAYHIMVNDTNVVEQAMNFVNTANPDSSGFPPILDIESNMVGNNRNDYRKKVLTWLQIVEKKTGGRPLIYCTDNVKAAYFSTPEFGRYNFWIANYTKKAPKTKGWKFWQFTDKGRARGVFGLVDVDVWCGTKEELEQWRKESWRGNR